MHQLERLEDRCLLSGSPEFTAAPWVYVPTSANELQAAVTVALDLLALHAEWDNYLESESISPQSFHDYSKTLRYNPNLQVTGDRVAVEIATAEHVSSIQAALADIGFEVLATADQYLSGWLPLSEIDGLSMLAGDTYTRAEYRSQTNAGTTTSQGDTAQLSAAIRERFSDLNLDGSGVKVGVISNSYNALDTADPLDGEEADVASGDLPGTGNPFGYTLPVNVIVDAAGGPDEGRAMLQIIHDIAPGAELFFHRAFGATQTASAIDALVAQEVHVIVDDLTPDAPFFQDGIVAQRVNAAAAAGMVYVTSAGNEGRLSYESAFVPGPTLDFLGHDETVHLFDEVSSDYRQRVTIPDGGSLSLYLQWDRKYNLPHINPNNLNMYLLAGDEIVAQGSFGNIGIPAELLVFTNDNTGTTEFDVVITLASGSAPELMKYYESASSSLFPELRAEFQEYLTDSSTIIGHANAAGAITVGAADYRITPQFHGDAPQLESFSSAGGTPILFDTSGNRLTTPEIRMKPDIVGPDNGNTTFFGEELLGINPFIDPEDDGFPNFAGTSASAPHIAGLVALMLQANPNLTPAQVKAALTSTAIDMDDPFTPGFDVGFDYGTGYGFVNGMAAITSVLTDTLPPQVMNVIVSRSAAGATDPPYAMNQVALGKQLRTVPVGGIDTIAVQFSEAVTNISSTDLGFLAMRQLTSSQTVYIPTIDNFTPPDAANNYTATWQFTAPITHGDYYLLSLPDTIEDLDGNALDGEWINPVSITTTNSLVSEFPSGDGQPGGGFNFILTILPGDANRSLDVGLPDLAIVLNNQGVGMLFIQGNFDGTGTTGLPDLAVVLNFQGVNLTQLGLFLWADLNVDGVVDEEYDRDTLIGNMGMSNPTREDGDLDGDNDVDNDDLDILLAQLGSAFAAVN